MNVHRAIVSADDANLVLQLERGLQDPVHDRLRKHIGYPDDQTHRLPAGPSLEVSWNSRPSEKISSAYRNAMRPLSVNTRLRPLRVNSFSPRTSSRTADLTADRRMRQASSLPACVMLPLLRNDPEVEQVVVVEPLHRETSMSPSPSGRGGSADEHAGVQDPARIELALDRDQRVAEQRRRSRSYHGRWIRPTRGDA